MSSDSGSNGIRFSTGKTVLYSVLLTLAGFGIIELFARFTQPGLRDLPRFLVRSIDTDIELPFMQPDPELFWKPTPGYAGPMWDGRVTIGTDGLRSHKTSLRGNPRHLLCFGDSITFGFGVSDNESYPAALSARLEPLGMEVRNAGVTGYTSYQTLRRLKQELKSQRPEIVTLLIGWNDGTRRAMTDAEFAVRLQSTASTTDEVLRHLAIYRLMKAMWLRRGLPSAGQAPRVTARVPLDDYAANLETFVREARAAGAKPIFVALPSRLIQGGKPSLSPYSEVEAAVAQRLSVPLLDVGILSSTSKDIAATGNGSYFIDSLHFSPEGSRLMATLLANQIEPLIR